MRGGLERSWVHNSADTLFHLRARMQGANANAGGPDECPRRAHLNAEIVIHTQGREHGICEVQKVAACTAPIPDLPNIGLVPAWLAASKVTSTPKLLLSRGTHWASDIITQAGPVGVSFTMPLT